MLKKLKQFFADELSIENEVAPEQKLREACAALLIEVSLADQQQTEDEMETISKLLEKEFSLSHETLSELMEYAKENGAEQTSVHPFTSLVNENYSYEQKVNLIELMWEVAHADGDLDKYEDHVIRNMAELLYISHSDFIKCKLKAAENNQ